MSPRRKLCHVKLWKGFRVGEICMPTGVTPNFCGLLDMNSESDTHADTGPQLSILGSSLQRLQIGSVMPPGPAPNDGFSFESSIPRSLAPKPYTLWTTSANPENSTCHPKRNSNQEHDTHPDPSPQLSPQEFSSVLADHICHDPRS